MKTATPMSRRHALRNLAAGTLTVAPFLRGFAARAADSSDRPPKRFVFIVRSNGILPTEIQPRGLEDLVRVRFHPGQVEKFREEPLAKLELSESTAALEPFKHKVTVIQGLSGKMASSDHNAKFGAFGAYKSGNFPTLPTVDAVLAEGLDSPFPHLGFAMEQAGPQVVYPPLSASGVKKPLPYYADPLTAYGDLFGSVLSDDKLRAAAQVDKNLLDFMAGDVKQFQKSLPVQEKEKLEIYLDGFKALQTRARRLASMEEDLRRAIPSLSDKYGSEIETERLDSHFELATSALIGGLTNVVAIRAEHLGMRLTGLGLGTKTVHHIGHMIEGKGGNSSGGGQDFDNGMGEFATRAVVMKYHMANIAAMADKLSRVPEGDGNMLDNTVILYLSDHGDRHHSPFTIWPMLAVGDAGGALRAGRYLHLPEYRSPGHRTIANLYLSLLHAAGLPQESFGQPDLTLPGSIDQKGPLEQWMRA